MGRYSEHRPIPRFDRDFLGSGERFSRIGGGPIGGKAEGLVFIERSLAEGLDPAAIAGDLGRIETGIPRMVVIATDLFDAFLERNGLRSIAVEGESDRAIASRFQRADLPAEMLGDLRALVEQIRVPLAIRSSSLLEDALDQPFAGVYATKMIPNNQHDADTRFRRLTEAVKFVYASAFLERARDYVRATGRDPGEEKMAVIAQEVVGRRHGDRFYPDVSGVARSINYYPIGNARPEDGVVSLALGLGKTIVDGGVAWTYSPAWPQAPPPYASPADLLRGTQLQFWAVNMGPPPPYDPLTETEYLLRSGLDAAEADGTLAAVASTYLAASDRLVPGTGPDGPRALTFAPLLAPGGWRLNDLLRALLEVAERALGEAVEIEFALTLPGRNGEVWRESGAPERGGAARFGLLQTRAMAAAGHAVSIDPAEMAGSGVLAASRRVMGNGSHETIRDIVYVRPERFDPMRTGAIAAEVAVVNRQLTAEHRPYLLIGFGRWGTSEPTLGVPVEWGQIAGARALVEASLPGMDVEPSQGSHFFHNITAFRVACLTVGHEDEPGIDWGWLESRPASSEGAFVRHLRLDRPLLVKVDAGARLGVIRHAPDGSP
jgi:pyruvate phosphate dikinase-like enzyme